MMTRYEKFLPFIYDGKQQLAIKMLISHSKEPEFTDEQHKILHDAEQEYKKFYDDAVKHYLRISHAYSEPILKREHVGDRWGNTVSCSWCDHFNTHQCGVEIYDRCEDDDNCKHISVLTLSDQMFSKRPDDVVVDYDFNSDNSDNPSDRRQGVRILCVCEYCERITSMNVFQHKGFTCVHTEKYRGKNSKTLDAICKR